MKEIDCKLTHSFDEYPGFGVLEGVKVFVTGTNIAGPFAGCIMAEMGAKVLQAEMPNVTCSTRGTTGWSQNHRNEFSINFNSATPAGKKSSSSASSGRTSGSKTARRAPMPSAASPMRSAGSTTRS